MSRAFLKHGKRSVRILRWRREFAYLALWVHHTCRSTVGQGINVEVIHVTRLVITVYLLIAKSDCQVPHVYLECRRISRIFPLQMCDTSLLA